VKFEDGLSISVMNNRATRHTFLQREIAKFPKSQAARLLFISQPAYFKTLVCISIGHDLAHVRASKMTGTRSKEKSQGDGLK
jgi:hypothetical protein